MKKSQFKFTKYEVPGIILVRETLTNNEENDPSLAKITEFLDKSIIIG